MIDSWFICAGPLIWNWTTCFLTSLQQCLTASKPSARRRRLLNGLASSVSLDRTAERVPLEADPELFRFRPRPILIDEWQNVAKVWDVVRHAADRDPSGGQFLLVGSAMPWAGATAHSGAGRIGRLRMRPMTLEERRKKGGGTGREPNAPFGGRPRAASRANRCATGEICRGDSGVRLSRSPFAQWPCSAFSA